jgi:hypothetical protein
MHLAQTASAIPRIDMHALKVVTNGTSDKQPKTLPNTKEPRTKAEAPRSPFPMLLMLEENMRQV